MNNNRYLKTKKLISLFLTAVMLGTVLCGCDLDLGSGKFDKVKEEQVVETIPVKKSDEIIVVEKIEEIGSEEDSNTADLSQVDFAKAQNEIISEGSRYYAYSRLTEDEQLIYTEVLGILNTFGKDVKVSSLNPDMIDKAFRCVLIDHPELFYISGYSYTKFMRGEKLEKITVTGSYTMTEKEAVQAAERIDEYTEACVSGYTGGSDDYNKVKYVFEFLIKNNEYDLSAPNNQNILSVVDENRTVCQGYAKMTQYLLNKMGVFCTLCEGIVKGSESHVWNIVKINNDYYHVDTTWGDASYELASDSDAEIEIPEVNYEYLCITDDKIKETHVIKSSVDLPVCNSTDANYYVREGLYFTELNTEQLREAFNNAFENNDAYVTLKCENANVYAAMYSHLIEDQNVFEYLNGSNNVNYVEFKEECRMSFYL